MRRLQTTNDTVTTTVTTTDRVTSRNWTQGLVGDVVNRPATPGLSPVTNIVSPSPTPNPSLIIEERETHPDEGAKEKEKEREHKDLPEEQVALGEESSTIARNIVQEEVQQHIAADRDILIVSAPILATSIENINMVQNAVEDNINRIVGSVGTNLQLQRDTIAAIATADTADLIKHERNVEGSNTEAAGENEGRICSTIGPFVPEKPLGLIPSCINWLSQLDLARKLGFGLASAFFVGGVAYFIFTRAGGATASAASVTLGDTNININIPPMPTQTLAPAARTLVHTAAGAVEVYISADSLKKLGLSATGI